MKLDILLNGQPVDAMATIVHRLKAQRVGRELVEKLKKFIDRCIDLVSYSTICDFPLCRDYINTIYYIEQANV